MKYNMYNHRRNVLELQAFLRANYLLEGGVLVNPDGIFDSVTTEAVKLFQQQNGLEITGVVNYPTWKLLAKNAELLCLENQCLLINLDIAPRQ